MSATASEKLRNHTEQSLRCVRLCQSDANGSLVIRPRGVAHHQLISCKLRPRNSHPQLISCSHKRMTFRAGHIATNPLQTHPPRSEPAPSLTPPRAPLTYSQLRRPPRRRVLVQERPAPKKATMRELSISPPSSLRRERTSPQRPLARLPASHSRQVSRQKVAQRLRPDLVLEVARAQVNPGAVEPGLLDLCLLLGQDLVDVGGRDLGPVDRRRAVVDPVPQLRPRDFGLSKQRHTVSDSYLEPAAMAAIKLTVAASSIMLLTGTQPSPPIQFAQ